MIISLPLPKQVKRDEAVHCSLLGHSLVLEDNTALSQHGPVQLPEVQAPSFLCHSLAPLHNPLNLLFIMNSQTTKM